SHFHSRALSSPPGYRQRDKNSTALAGGLSCRLCLLCGSVNLEKKGQIQRGLVIYICFFKGADEDLVPKIVDTLLNVKLSENENGEFVSVLDLPGDVLIIPQATLGGKPKGRKMQYHANIEKEKGSELYSQFVTLCEKELTANAKCMEAGVLVKHGTYGNRQVLKLDTNGPYTHLIEF
ncbi:hypothetical protein Nmel_008996, partial [Mimus melanotis]